MTDNPEETAKRIAEQGREALLARLRPAFEEAVSAHADVLSLDSDQVEQMVQQAADRADGLQWRRALASIATEELGISLGEALSSPVVERAQVIVGAPSYEESLAKLGIEVPAQAESTEDQARQEDLPEPEAASPEDDHAEVEDQAELAAEPASELEASSDPEDALAHDAEAEEAAPEEADQDEHDDETALHPDPAPADDEDLEPLRLGATHIGGIATLQAGEEGLELRFGRPGLDIARKPGRVLGRLRWREINALEVAPAKGLRRRRRADRAHLVIRTEHGDATFEIPSVTEEELRENIAPLVERYRQR